jgi:hypothetical protein
VEITTPAPDGGGRCRRLRPAARALRRLQPSLRRGLRRTAGCGRVHFVGQGPTDSVEAAQQSPDFGTGGVAQLGEPLEFLRGVATGVFDGPLSRIARLSGAQMGPIPDALRFFLGGLRQLRGLLAGRGELDGGAFLGGGHGRFPFLPFPAPVLLVPGDLGLRLGEQRGGAPFRGLTDLCGLLLGGAQQPFQTRTQPTVARRLRGGVLGLWTTLVHRLHRSEVLHVAVEATGGQLGDRHGRRDVPEVVQRDGQLVVSIEHHTAMGAGAVSFRLFDRTGSQATR